MRAARAALLAAAGALVLAAPVRAQRARAVLSADMRPYQEAWDGFREALGGDAEMALAGDDAGAPGPSVVVAFGAKAALQSYRGSPRVIVAMAPSVSVRRPGRADALRVCMTPDPSALLARMKALQPGLRRLGVVWKSEFYGEQYLPLLREAARDSGVEIASYPLGDDADIPAQVREMGGRVDALWLPPDPLVISERNFFLFRDFSLGSRVPLYVPVPGLAERGAAASIGVSFRSIGRTAGLAARRVLDGAEPPPLTFPAPTEIVVNPKAAAAAGLELSPEILRAATRVVP